MTAGKKTRKELGRVVARGNAPVAIGCSRNPRAACGARKNPDTLSLGGRPGLEAQERSGQVVNRQMEVRVDQGWRANT